jgi:anthranilate phosphoribosyltransferase
MFQQAIATIESGRNLTAAQCADAIDAIMAGELDDDTIERFLRAIMQKGESIDELVGGATAMRRHVTPIECHHVDAIDTCGTGGDGISTFNVSTAAALVAAAAGAKVAKHGNRSNSRKSGSVEVLVALGVNVDAPPETVARCLRDIGIGFLFAAKLHPAMGRVAHIRRKIGLPTIFNLLGPLTNPAAVKRQIIGVPRGELIPKIAEALKQLGAVHALVVHGDDGLCDFTITGPSQYAELRDGEIAFRTLSPVDVGMTCHNIDTLRIASPEESAAVIRGVLARDHTPARDHTLLNAAAALVVGNVATDFRDGLRLAAEAIDNGEAGRTLEQLVRLTREA